MSRTIDLLLLVAGKGVWLIGAILAIVAMQSVSSQLLPVYLMLIGIGLAQMGSTARLPIG